jgi:Family of unknown function (DUF6622)
MFIAIIQHTPAWVFGVLVALVALGVAQSVPRRVSLRRNIVVPLTLAAWSLSGAVSTFGGQPLALLAWVIALAATMLALHGRVATTGVRYVADEQAFAMPGGWGPLALMMGLFGLRFGAGVMLADDPDLRHSAAFAVAACTAYGTFSGVFLGRAMALWSLARRTLQPLAA